MSEDPDRVVGMESGLWFNPESPGFRRGLLVEWGENFALNAKTLGEAIRDAASSRAVSRAGIPADTSA